MVREAGAGDQEEINSLLLAAFQEMPFQFPPIEEEGLYRAGFWVPTSVLRRGRGDCDSKSTALCSLWPNNGPQMILFVIAIPEKERQLLSPSRQADYHALLGIEAYPGIDQATVRVGVRNYVLWEVVTPSRSGLEKLVPGQALFSVLPGAGFCLTDNCNGP